MKILIKTCVKIYSFETQLLIRVELQVISGQYVCSNYTASTQVEVEIIGISVDCAKHKTKVIPRNSLNPIWNDVFTFQVTTFSPVPCQLPLQCVVLCGDFQANLQYT